MTIKDLEQYRQLQNEVKQLSLRLENFPDYIVSDSVRGSSRNMPYQELIITITGVDPRSQAKFNGLKEKLEKRANRLRDSLIEIEEFIDQVPRSEIRRIIDYRYIQGYSWASVSKRVYGYPSETRARMAVTRYFAEI